jgi:hypothetical protein
MDFIQVLQGQLRTAEHERDQLQNQYKDLHTTYIQYRQALVSEMQLRDVVEKREQSALALIKRLQLQISDMETQSQVETKSEEADRKRRKRAKIQGIVADMLIDSPKVEGIGAESSKRKMKAEVKVERNITRELRE